MTTADRYVPGVNRFAHCSQVESSLDLYYSPGSKLRVVMTVLCDKPLKNGRRWYFIKVSIDDTRSDARKSLADVRLVGPDPTLYALALPVARGGNAAPLIDWLRENAPAWFVAVLEAAEGDA